MLYPSKEETPASITPHRDTHPGCVTVPFEEGDESPFVGLLEVEAA